jgi:hypothetical protein
MLSAVAASRRALRLCALAVVLAVAFGAIGSSAAATAKPPASGPHAKKAGKRHAQAKKSKRKSKACKHRKTRNQRKRCRKKRRSNQGVATTLPLTDGAPSGAPSPDASGDTAAQQPRPAPQPISGSSATGGQPGPGPSGGTPDAPRTEFPLWRGGFETGDFSQWKQLNGNHADRDRYFGLVTNPVEEGRYAFRSTVDAGATEAGEAGQRSMVLLFPSNVPQQNATGAYEGSERWYRTSLYFPDDFDASPNQSWNWLVQWHNWPDGVCCSNLALSVDTRRGGEKLSLRVMGGGDQAHPIETSSVIKEQNPAGFMEWFVGDPALRRNHWYDSLMHVKWSADPSKGRVEWWLDGRQIVSRAMPTLYWYADNNRNYAGATPGPGQAYYIEGYYRPSTLPGGALDTSSETVYFDGAQMGPSAASVVR